MSPGFWVSLTLLVGLFATMLITHLVGSTLSDRYGNAAAFYGASVTLCLCLAATLAVLDLVIS